jgi:hypothetical protein
MNCIIQCDGDNIQEKLKDKKKEKEQELMVTSFGQAEKVSSSEQAGKIPSLCQASCASSGRVATFSDALQNVSCQLKRELIDNNRSVVGALTRSTLDTAIEWGKFKLTDLLETNGPSWLTK